MIVESTQQKRTPVALFLYNRPEHARLTLESLSGCRRLDECLLRIYCDGPKQPEHVAAITAVRKLAHEWGTKLGAEVVERDTNLGLARSIVEGVSELCASHGRVIVLEDDFTLSPSFLDYMLQALDRYADEPKVYQISGYMYPVLHAPQPDAFFLPLTTTWGWATWSRAWQIFDWNATDAQVLLRDPELRKRFDLGNSYPYANMLEEKLRGENDSWGILFWWSVFKAGGLALHPRQSLVWNRGFDNTGTHCGDRSWSNTPSVDITKSDENSLTTFKLPAEVVPNEAAFNKLVQFLRAEQYPDNLIDRIRRRIFLRRKRRESNRLHPNNAA